MPVGAVAAFWGVSVLLVLTPGADWAYTINAGLRHRSVFPAIAGLLTGYVLITGLVAAGIATLLAGAPRVSAALTVAGAAYLVWLGVTTLARPTGPVDAPGSGTSSGSRQLLKGVGISGLNPKALLLFLALLPQFTVSTSAWPIAAQIALLGLVHTATCGVVYTCVGTGARLVLRTRPAAATVVTVVSGLAMTAIGVVLLVEQFLR
ncbi:LysE family translocator [Nakamurella flava]|uniref:LysE family translocator n=1 Tax=Nakamurella flava TaxID=2576308 RepID=A0A4U6QCI3_9ACTN|nr:LysE family translocator [Nakamurella flava]TKV57662.1 LysE family translocator [Nakamurella flava]